MTFNSHIIKRDMTTIKIKTITMIHNTNNMAIITIKEIIRIMTNTKIMMVNMIMKGNTITMKVSNNYKSRIKPIKHIYNKTYIE